MNERSVGIFSAASMTILGTTCCALPITLVALGAGGAMASLASAAPWLVVLSKYKAWTFGITASLLAYAWFQATHKGADECDIESRRKLILQRRVLIGSTALFAFSLFAAYALLPITLWIEKH